MEIWKAKDDGWVKGPFLLKKKRVPVFFKQEIPLASLVYEELQRGGQQRYIVFNNIEARKLTVIGALFLNSSRAAVGCDFIHLVLEPVRDVYRKMFSATQIAEKHVLIPKIGDKTRIAIRIDE